MAPIPRVVHDSLGILERIGNKHGLTTAQKDRIKAIRTEIWFLGMFFRLKNKHRDKISVLMDQVEDHLDDLDHSWWTTTVAAASNFDSMTSNVLQVIWKSKKEIGDYYSYAKLSGSSALTHELVVESIDTLVQNLKELLSTRLGNELVTIPDDHDSMIKQVAVQMEMLEKELTVLKKFINFLGRVRSSEPQICWEKFLSHVEVAVTNAAVVSFLYVPNPKDEQSIVIDKTGLLLDLLQKKIKPIEPQVCSIYTDVLRDIRLAGNSPLVSSIEPAIAGFIETLLHISDGLRGLFPLAKGQTETLAEQLNSLKTILDELPLFDNIQDMMRNRFFRRLQTVVIDVGMVVYSSYNSNKGQEDRHQELLVLADTIQLVKTQIYRDIREWVKIHLPKNDALGSINFLQQSFKDLLCSKSTSLTSLKDKLDLFNEELQFFQPFMKDLAEGVNKNVELQTIAAKVTEKTYEFEYIVDSLEVGDVPLTYLTMWLSALIDEIKIIKVDLQKSREMKMKIAFPSTNEEPVGFADVKEIMRCRIVKGSSKLDVVSIVGMPGIGKTTLARSISNEESVISHFDFVAECCVSQVYTRRDLLLNILSYAIEEPTDLSTEGESELAARLKKALIRRRRFLIIVDDVWEKNAWDDLEICFPDNENGSRIILTTRLWEVAMHAKRVTDPHNLRLFDDKESWSLLEKKVFGEEICPEELKEAGIDIAKKCKGLPLSIVLVAGVLARMDKEKESWKQVGLSLGAQIQGPSKDLLQLSYNDLPHKLKPCFLYFGTFVEDRQISVTKLTSLWIAEEFIENDTEKALEDIAEDYLEDLIGRNLVMVTKKSSSTGKTKACRVHDVLLDFCKEKAEELNFLLWVKRDDNSNSNLYSQKPMQRRLAFLSNRDRLVGWIPSRSHARSVLFREVSVDTFSSMKDASNIFASFKFLRVLDLEFVIIDSFPTELKYLRYFALRTAKDFIPNCIDNFWNLETFLVIGMQGDVRLPDTFWNLVKLRHVYIRNRAIFKLNGPKKFLDESQSKLEKLETLSSPYVNSAEDLERIVRKTPNLRKLRCIFDRSLGCGKNGKRFPVLDPLSQLQILKVIFFRTPEKCPSGVHFPSNLKKLTLSCFPLTLAAISTVSNLVTLEVLKLQQVVFEMGTWEVRDKEFAQLKFLKLENLKLSKWTASDDGAFLCLEKLVLHRCLHLEAVPSCFEELGYLQYIEVKSCSDDVALSAKSIKETRVDNGYKCDLKVFM